MPIRCVIGGKRFTKNRDQAKKLYDERFCRMWELYLTAFGSRICRGDIDGLSDVDFAPARYSTPDPRLHV